MSFFGIGLLIVLGCVLLEGCAQLCLKQSTRSNNKYWIVLALALFIIPIVAYTWALKFLPVNVAFPLSSLTFVVVAVLSKLFLYEDIAPLRWAGIGFILLGVILVTSRF
jgi:multidrug transporter EmrE-like cation transporter